MQPDLPTLTLEQYQNILQLEKFTIKKENLINNTTIYPDKLSIFLKNYLNEIECHTENKNE